MNFEKTHLCRLPCCYAVSPLTLDGRLKYLLATDDHGPCYCIDAQTLEQETVWEETGGTMSIIPLPGTNGEFLASQRFLRIRRPPRPHRPHDPGKRPVDGAALDGAALCSPL